METSSEYNFPIFISSTDYNLKDLRAELARFLAELGYKPYLSSAEGFPDSSPDLEPWESCIPVLEGSFVMILIIDGRYGTSLDWPNYNEYFEDKKLSPTHGEYIFAHKNRKRMLVFIRKSLMPHYQSYRKVMKDCGLDKEKAKQILYPTLPEPVSFETLDFINEVKTSKPIPWINEFEDVTNIKREVQKKMLNELAELFLIKNKHTSIVIDAFNKLMDSLVPDKRREVLQKVFATKEIFDAADELHKYETELNEAKEKIAKAQDSSEEQKREYEQKIAYLEKQIESLKEITYGNPFYIENERLKYKNYIDSAQNSFWTRLFSNAQTNTAGSFSDVKNESKYEFISPIELGTQLPKPSIIKLKREPDTVLKEEINLASAEETSSTSNANLEES